MRQETPGEIKEAISEVGVQESDVASIRKASGKSRTYDYIIIVITSLFLGFVLGGPIFSQAGKSSYPYAITPIVIGMASSSKLEKAMGRGGVAIFGFLLGSFLSANMFSVMTLYGVAGRAK